MNEAIFAAGRKKMDDVVTLVKADLLNVQTGRAKPSLVESISVEAYEGSTMMVKELASISALDVHTLVISPWDKSLTEKIAKGISQSDLHINPVVDGETIRLSVPQLTEERRQELVKAVKQKIESGKAMLRQIRIDMKRDIDEQKEQAGVSEDDIHDMQDKLQKQIDEYNAQMDTIEKQKETELMTL